MSLRARQVNKLLTKSVKSFIKTVVCYPQLTTHGQWKTFIHLHDSEKVHICLLAVEARRQAELLYALQAVMQLVGQRT